MQSPIGGAEPFQRHNPYGSPPRRSFYSCKRNQNTLGAAPQDPGRPAALDTNVVFPSMNREKQIRTARRWASKEPAAHFYRPRAGARKGEPPPLSPPLRRGTMVQVKQILLSLQNHFLGKSQSRTPATATHPIPPQSRAAVSPCTKCEWGAKMFHVKHFYFRLRSSSSSATRW